MAGNPLPGLTLQAYPVAQMGGAEAVRSHFRQMQSEASGNPLQVVSPAPLGEDGVMLMQYDREGAEVSRSITFLQGNLMIAVTGVTSDEVAACSGSGLNSLAEHIARGLRFSAPDTDPPTQSLLRL